MQRSIILPVATRYLMPLMLVFSIFLLLRGHNEVGGGFVGGLVAASALMLYAISTSPSALWKLLPLDPRFIAAIGLFISLFSGFIPLFYGKPFMTGMWIETPLPVLGKIGTPTLFDVGVYVLVIGVVVWILLEFAEDE
ncbi:MAG: Na+/H+ antiporter subunit B [Anaerolineaceae bacterium]|nr:Na+/H+ antiporter subunit B [Anaerolineaceae bacterium]